MADFEKTGERDLTYSAWHRINSTKRFVENPRAIPMIDMDMVLWIEYHNSTRIPVALVELARDVGQGYKNATVTKKLAEMAGIPAYCVLYKVSEKQNPANPKYKDIDEFRIKRLYPVFDKKWHILTPSLWAEHLLKLRE